MWRSADGTTWEQVNLDGFGDAANWTVDSLIAANGHLWAATFNRLTGTEVWRSPDGTTWEQVNTDGFGDGNNYGSPAMGVLGSFLYAGTYKAFEFGGLPCDVWRVELALFADGFESGDTSAWSMTIP